MNHKKQTVREEVLEWSRKFPIDFWWRKKHKVAFMSKEHRECSFLDQLFEYEEERLIEEIKESTLNPYRPNEGDFWKNSNQNDISEEDQIKNAKSEFEQYLKEQNG